MAAVVTDEAGWPFFERNPRLRVVVAARPEIAQRPAANVLTIVPIAAGDLASGYGGRDGEEFQLELSRPSIYAFREALIEIGVEESDARRLALATGRSWSVYRRRRAANQAIRRPEWLELPEADALATLCLLGAWHGEKAGDRAIVEQVTGEPYETVERKLRKLCRVDDAPVISIGEAWRAKAPLELLDLFADRITAAELDRSFEIVEALLVEPDPVLELDADKRWMAGVYGKVREESGLLFRSVLDALVKLAVRGRDYEGLTTLNVDARVERLVDRLLQDADATRWLSLASHLSPLAEAAPSAFLNAVEASLRRPANPVLALFRESASADSPLSGGAWYYADLPEERLKDFEQEDRRREELRLSGLQEIHRDLGLEGVLRLADLSRDPSIVGRCLLDVVPERAALADWMADLETDFGWGTSRALLVYGILGFLPEAETAAFLHRVIQLGRERGWPAERFAAFLRLARDERPTWDLAEQCGKEVGSAYWRIVAPWLWRADAADRDLAATKLMEADRPISALNMLIQHLDDANPSLLLQSLESALVHGETDAKFPDSWHLEELVARLEAWDVMDQERLLQLEFGLVPAFRLDATSALEALTTAITTKPELFTELVCLIWRPETGESRSESPPTEGERVAAENAWRLLHDCRRQPGALDNGDIDSDACVRFVAEALALCQQKDRAIMGEQTLGQILAHAPIGEDEIWPGAPARDILDRPELSEMRSGFEIGTFNKRGVTRRAMDEGGKQERELTAQFQRYADALAATHPHLAESLERMAQNYEFHAKREDDDAALNREQY